MKPRYLIGAILITAAVGTSVYLLSQSQIQYSTIATAKTSGRKVQIKGQWVDHDLTLYNTGTDTFQFILVDDSGEKIRVVYHGAKPNNFELAQTVVVRGRINGDYFEATEILTKCPSKYEGNTSLIPQKQ
ncbi:MAG: cytochrome c maturation protein CcmE [Chlorobi bacterium]|nr:cytochrome c maturation protein CcmE [Chlorobiota bacterium]